MGFITIGFHVFLTPVKNFIIDPSNVEEDPVHQFQNWYSEYLKTNPEEPTAVFLATAGKSHEPSGRVVLMKSFDERGFVFFTNYESRKGKDLAENPCANLTFFWQKMHRQVRIHGKAEKVSAQESDDYFKTRAYDSCLGAWASHQDEVIESREVLLQKVEQFKQKYSDPKSVPRPEYWGGYRVVPKRFEFWQGRDNRIHDRVEYVLEGKTWKRQRLAP
jgi:pyridoxamine 5'-phosphate oxidase